MDGARAIDLYWTVIAEVLFARRQALTSRRVVMEALTVAVWTVPEQPSVQILVVVANTQVRTLRTEVEKGST